MAVNQLVAVDRLEILILVDNVTDMLSTVKPVKSLKQSQAPWDYCRLVETVPASRAAIPVAESQCDRNKWQVHQVPK
jgi:hypothetical protein